MHSGSIYFNDCRAGIIVIEEKSLEKYNDIGCNRLGRAASGGWQEPTLNESNVGCVSAHNDVRTLAGLANKLRAEYVAVTGAGADMELLKELLDYDAEILSGPEALTRACTAGNPDMVVLSVLELRASRRLKSA